MYLTVFLFEMFLVEVFYLKVFLEKTPIKCFSKKTLQVIFLNFKSVS